MLDFLCGQLFMYCTLDTSSLEIWVLLMHLVASLSRDKASQIAASQIPFASQIARASQIASMLPELDQSVFELASFRFKGLFFWGV